MYTYMLTQTHFRLYIHVYTYMHLHTDVDADAFLSCRTVSHRWGLPSTKAMARWWRCSCSTAPSEGACLGARLGPSLAQSAAGCVVACHVRRRIHAKSSPSALASDTLSLKETLSNLVLRDRNMV